jgi:MOSC domain-containing protein YiiM
MRPMAEEPKAAFADVPRIERMGRVVALFTAARGGAPLEAQDEVELVTGVGIVGDRYAARTGYWSDPRWPDQQLTLVEAEVAEVLGLSPALLRRNVVTRDVELTQLIGARFRVGGVELRGVRVCDPCAYLERLVGRPGLMRDLGRAGGGLRTEVLTDGRIAVGDEVVLSAGARGARTG